MIGSKIYDTKIFKKKTEKLLGQFDKSLVYLFLSLSVFVFCFYFVGAVGPVGPDTIVLQDNETKAATNAIMLNISGGYIATINITTTSQNRKWKAFVGQVIGTFTLDDASGSTIYDWSIASVSGQVYATRNSTTILWTQIQCANTTVMERENLLMNHTNAFDNITRTFNMTSHDAFVVGITAIANDTCPSVRTFINNISNNSANRFDEAVLFDGVDQNSGSVVYATMIENNVVGFDGNSYDFQMIVPENGDPTFNSATAYYVYVEIR